MTVQHLSLSATSASYARALPLLRHLLDPPPHFSPVLVVPEEASPLVASPTPPRAITAEDCDPRTTLLISTSGTTGTPKYVQLAATHLHASIASTHERLGGPGAWLLALPPHHIAGLNVLLRSLTAGHTPGLLDTRDGFHLGAFATATDALCRNSPHQRHYTSLVPSQLHKILTTDTPDAHAAHTALACYDAILIGGARLHPSLADQARRAGIHIVATYGSSETTGGCVYDGIPLAGSTVDCDETGRIWISGPTVGYGYVGLPHHPAWQRPGWFRTDDHGHWDHHHLIVAGRCDDAISTGGLTIFPTVVEDALRSHPGIADIVIIGLPDERLGERVTAVIVPTWSGTHPDPLPSIEQCRQWVLDQGLPLTAVPREIRLYPDSPTAQPAAQPTDGPTGLGATRPLLPGKVNRQELRQRLLAENGRIDR